MNSLARTLLLMLFVSLSAAVQADTVTLKLVNTFPNNTAGGVYVYPYNFSINGSTTLTALLCDDFNHEVQLGESWHANVNTLANAAAGAGQFVGAATNYYQAGWLFEQLVNNAPYASPESINWAIWSIMSPNAVPTSAMGSASTSGSAAWWIQQASTTTIDPSALSNIVVYTWDGNTNTIVNGPGGPPQEYFGTVPEPASIILMLTGCSAIFLRRRKHAGRL